MNRELVQKWIDALRSGEYKQTQGCLKDDNGYCCIGVAADIHPNFDWNNIDDFYTCYLPMGINEDFGLEDFGLEYFGLYEFGKDNSMNLTLSKMNDYEGCKFAQIADYIEENILNKTE